VIYFAACGFALLEISRRALRRKLSEIFVGLQIAICNLLEFNLQLAICNIPKIALCFAFTNTGASA
jgi:hypothetical protein